MSKREGQPKIPENAPEAKKPKLCEETVDSQQLENVASQQRPNSPIPGPSSAPSDPNLHPFDTGLVPIYCYFDHTRVHDDSSQGSSFTNIGPSTSFSNTTSSIAMEFGSSRTTSVEDMDVDSEKTESFTSTDRKNDQHSKNKSCDDQ